MQGDFQEERTACCWVRDRIAALRVARRKGSKLSNRCVKRGEVYFARLGNKNIGSEQNGTRPVVVIQSDAAANSPVFICAVISNGVISVPDIQVSIRGKYEYGSKSSKNNLTGQLTLGR